MSSAPRALRSSSVLNIDERPSTPTRMVKVLDTEATKNTPNRAVRNLSQSESKITPRRSRRISKSEEPEEFDINVLKAVKHSETIDEDSDEISDQDVKAVKKAGAYLRSLQLKFLILILVI